MKEFVTLGQFLNDAKYDFPNVDNRTELNKKINELNSKVYEFDLLMLKAIKNDKGSHLES